ncbi:unnamed protein product [Urochloa humidicola]
MVFFFLNGRAFLAHCSKDNNWTPCCSAAGCATAGTTDNIARPLLHVLVLGAGATATALVYTLGRSSREVPEEEGIPD